MYVDELDSISHLKEQISKITKIEADEQRLIYSGKELTDSQTISYYEVKNGAVVHLLIRPRKVSPWVA